MRYKLLFLMLLIANVAFGQTGSVNYTDIALTKVTSKGTLLGKSTVVKKKDFIFSTYKDKNISITFNGSSPQVHFILLNRNSSPIKLLWNEVVYIANGEQYSFIHKGQTKLDFEKEKNAATIIDGATITDEIWPTISYEWGYMWAEEGSTIRVVLPIKIGVKRIDYNFYFKVVNFKGKYYKNRIEDENMRWLIFKSTN